MIWLAVIFVGGVFVLSCIDVFKNFNENAKKVKEAGIYYDKIENGMSLIEVNSFLSSKGKLISEQDGISIYKWGIGDAILGKEYLKDNESSKEVSLSEYLKNANKYYLTKGKAFVEISLKNNKVCNKKAIGLS